MPSKAIPEGWRDYRPVGVRIPGTKFIAFKVPLKMNLCRSNLSEDEWFTPTMLLHKVPNLKAVVDLTKTNRYYDAQIELVSKGVAHTKMMMEGQGKVPSESQVKCFLDTVNVYLKMYEKNVDALIGVHCTHGLNRTGYLLCRWMIEHLKISPNDAINRFNTARGHAITRQNLLSHLRSLPVKSDPYNLSPLSHALDEASGSTKTKKRINAGP
ncbi:hypothetical protein ABEB36_000944 [Hypothenemus hampei]|uniref:Tyrosine specific protein phosphatases domain-containing protein n=1 Tax=Hypothenemus hampei TaxID=57062 RepID=A0ABD1FCY3_HYPHA